MVAPHTVISTAPSIDEEDPVCLNTLGAVGGLDYSSALPGGTDAVQFTLDVPLRFDHRALTAQRRIKVYSATFCVAHGTMLDPERGSPWRISAAGLAGPAANTAAIFSTYPPPATHPTNDVVDQAIGRGALQWRRADILPDPGATPPDYIGTMSDYLGLVTMATGQSWRIEPRGAHLEFFAVPSSPDWIIDMVDTPGGRTTGDYWTSVVALYWDSATSPAKVKPLVATNSVAEAQFVRQEKLIDLTGGFGGKDYGPLSSTQVGILLGKVLAATAPQPTFTGEAVIPEGHVRNRGGSPVDSSQVHAGQLVTFVGVEPDPATALLSFTTAVTAQLGAVSYAVDTGLLKVTPVAPATRDLEGILTALEQKRLHPRLAA